MIIDLPGTTTAAINKYLVKLRHDIGAMTLGRVLTLVIVVGENDAEPAIEAANDASRQHPCRIIAVISSTKTGPSRLDAQIRHGGEAGAGEVVVLRLHGPLSAHGDSVLVPLLLPDSPVVAWWPREAPLDVSGSAIGQMAQRRITDAAEASSPRAELKRRADTYQPGDTDLAWTRVTLWRGLLAAALDQPPYEPVLEAEVAGASDSPSADLMAAWLAQALQCPVSRLRTEPGTGVTSVRLTRPSGNTDLLRPDGAVATLSPPGQPVRRISLARRELAECLADELHRLDPDDVYAATLTRGLAMIEAPASKQSGMPAGATAAARQSGTKAARQSDTKAGKQSGTKGARQAVTPTTRQEESPA